MNKSLTINKATLSNCRIGYNYYIEAKEDDMKFTEALGEVLEMAKTQIKPTEGDQEILIRKVQVYQKIKDFHKYLLEYGE